MIVQDKKNDLVAVNPCYERKIYGWCFCSIEGAYGTISNLNRDYEKLSLIISILLQETTTSNQSFFSSTNLHLFVEANNNKLHVSINGTDHTTTQVINLNQIYVIIIRYDASTFKLYVNSELIFSEVMSNKITIVGNAYLCSNSNQTQGWKGLIDEFRFFDELIAEELIIVSQNYTEYYDVWWNQTSLKFLIENITYTTSVDGISSIATIYIIDTTKVFRRVISNNSNIIIFQEGLIVFNGKVDVKTVTAKSNDGLRANYLQLSVIANSIILTQRYIINRTFSGNLESIITEIVNTYCHQNYGPVYFDTGKIEDTEDFEIIIERKSVAIVLLELAIRFNFKLIIQPRVSMPQKIHLISQESLKLPIDLVWKNYKETTPGFKFKNYQLIEDSRNESNSVTVKGRTSARDNDEPVGVTIEDVNRGYELGVAESPLITDMTINTNAEAEIIANNQLNIKKEYQTIDVEINSTPIIQAGFSFNMKIDDHRINERFYITEVTHLQKPYVTILKTNNNYLYIASVIEDIINKLEKEENTNVSSEEILKKIFLIDMGKITISGSCKVYEKERFFDTLGEIIIGEYQLGGFTKLADDDLILLGTNDLILTPIGLTLLIADNAHEFFFGFGKGFKKSWSY